MKRVSTIILALILCTALCLPAFAANPQTVQDGVIEITFSDVSRVVKQPIKITELDGTVAEKTIDLYVLPDTGSEITTKSPSPETALVIINYMLNGDAYTLSAFGDYANPLDAKTAVSVSDELNGIGVSFDGTVYAYYTYEYYYRKMESAMPTEPKPRSEAPATSDTKLEVIPTNQKLTVNGNEEKTEIYNINGANYFKLRDMAALLSGTGSQFSVDFDGSSNTVVVKTGEPYRPVGGELSMGKDNSASTVKSPQAIQINGEKVDLTAYNIGGSNFFKLRDLGTALGFDVDYDQATATMIVTSK